MPAQLRSVPAERTPERIKLAAEIERHTTAAERLQRTRDACEAIFAKCLAATAARDRAEAALAEARDAAPAELIAHLVGDAATPRAVEDAEAALAAAIADDVQVHRNQAALQDELRRAETAAQMAKSFRDEALNAVVAASPAVTALLAEHAATRDRLDELTLILDDVIGPVRLPNLWAARVIPDRTATSLAVSAAPWRTAIAALATDPDAALP